MAKNIYRDALLMESKENHAISLMIKFSLFEDECFPVLKNPFGEACYNAAITNYKSNYKRYVHRYVAIAHIYHSLINCSSLFDINVRLHLRKKITVRDEQLKKFQWLCMKAMFNNFSFRMKNFARPLWILYLMRAKTRHHTGINIIT